jgi:DNA repair protein RecN (Recombination protein N)
MLTELFIRDFAIVTKLELGFEAGLTVLTGETGAGKSILVDALALALGERADSGVIRQGCARSEIIAGFTLKPDQDAARWLEAHDLFGDRECVLRRVIEADKASKAYINGRPVPLQQLRELGEHLVDIHGQHEHQSLLRRDAQRQMLDDFAQLADRVDALAGHYQQLKALETRRENLSRESSDRAARIELLRYQVQELRALDLAADEIPRLEDEHARLANASELIQGVQAVAQTLYEDDDSAVARLLAQAQRKLDSLSAFDAKLGELNALLNEAAIQVDEAGGRLRHYLDTLELDPQRLAYVEQRLSAALDLARKHRVRPEELPQVLERLDTELNDIEHRDENLAKLEQQIKEARATYMKLAGDISKKRQDAAQTLGREVSAQLQDLGMPGGVFEPALTPLAAGELGAHGLERVEFMVSANPGQPLKPLTKVASGGELSRISLGLQVVTARVGRIPALIFDEVDVGIGGGVAEIVGRQLRTLGGKRQVLCITHLPQVAAQGHHHLQVSKHKKAGAAVVQIQTLPPKERIAEIARMLGGVEITRQTLAHAEDMLSRASA